MRVLLFLFSLPTESRGSDAYIASAGFTEPFLNTSTRYHNSMRPDFVSAGARTVADLAVYFEELKASARAFDDAFGASHRGYFTPTEDEQLRQLLVSYCQARAALLELCTEFRDGKDLTDAERPAAFLVAYAGAILLVDAARFLRERFDDKPVVVTKLNEPEPHFGIPAKTYQHLQASLTDPMHAWHLFHANDYFDQHKRELRALARDPALAPAMSVIDRLGGRVRVSPADFALARVKVQAERLANKLKRDTLGQLLYDLQERVSCMVSGVHTRPNHQPALPAAVKDALRAALRPGDVFVTRKEHALTNYFLPGFWPHAALYLGDCDALQSLGIHDHPNVAPRWRSLLDPPGAHPGECCRVIEALKDGVRIRSLSSPLASDAIAVIRPTLGQTDIALALARGLFHEGKPYDFDFDFTRSDRLVCSEVVYRSYEGIGGVRFDLTRRVGRLTLAPEDLLRMALAGNHFTPVAVYAQGFTDGLAIGADAGRALRETMRSE